MEQTSCATANIDRSVFTALLDARIGTAPAMPIAEDISREPITYARLTLGAAVLGRRLAAVAPLGGIVGLMLPNANGAVVTFMALQAFGRVPAMLNVSAGADGMLAACSAAGVTDGPVVACFRRAGETWPPPWRRWRRLSASSGWRTFGQVSERAPRCVAGWMPVSPVACLGRGCRRRPRPLCCSPADRKACRRAWC